jgi:membrane-bound metal-dependent hydrolase YbcI (DUF457 family)
MLFLGSQSPNRLVLHSLFGSATIGTVIAIIITIRIFPSLITYFLGVDKVKVKPKCSLSFSLVLSVLIGNISHVLLDVTNHPYNPIFWPFLENAYLTSPVFFALGEQLRHLWIQVIMGVLLITIIIIERKNIAENMLVG